MSVDLKRQLVVYGEHLEHLATSAAPDMESSVPPARRRTRWWAIAVAAAATVFVLIGAIALIAPFSGEESTPITDPPTPTTMPATTIPVVPVPDAAVPDRSASGLINEVQDLALAPDGTVWAATRGGVVAWDNGASVPEVYGEEDGLPAADVRQIVVAVDGTVWAAGYDWVAYYDETWQVVEAVNPPPWTLVADPTGGVWTEGDEQLVHVDRNGTEQIRLPSMMGLRSSVLIAVDAAGRVYAMEPGESHAVYIYEEGAWREFTTVAWPPGGTYSSIVTNIAIASDGTLWISTTRDSDPEPEGSPAHGVASFDGQAWTTYTTADGLAADAGIVRVAPDGTVWVVHGDAVSRFDGDIWTAYHVAGSPRSGAAGGVDGGIWLGTNNGIVHFDGDTTTRYVVPIEMTPVSGSFSLQPMASAAPPVHAGSFGDIAWQKLNLPAGHRLTGGIATPHGFAATGNTSIRTSIDGVNWATSEPPLDARHLISSGDDLYALGAGATRLTWTGATWEVVDDLNIPDPGPEIRAEGGYVDFAERMAFGDGVTVMTARSRVFYSTDGHTFVPAVRGPDPALLTGADNTGRCQPSFGGGSEENEIGPVVTTESGFVALTAGSPGGWDEFPLCEPVIWTSNDGSTWDLDSAESPFGPTSYVYDIAERNGLLVAVGGRGESGVLWTSDDGLTWNEIRPERISGTLTSWPWGIAAGEAGWVALFDCPEVRAMYSFDGLNWVVVAEEIPDFGWSFGTPDVAVGTDQILITYFTDVAYIGQITR